MAVLGHSEYVITSLLDIFVILLTGSAYTHVHPHFYPLTIKPMFRASLVTGFALAIVAALVAAKRQTRRALAPVRAGRKASRA